MEKKHITNYLAQKGKTTHNTAISHLVREINKISQGLKDPVNRALIGIEGKDIKPRERLTAEQKLLAQGARVDQIDIKSGVISKITTKKGAKKQVPISVKFKNILKGLTERAKKIAKDNFIFRRKDNLPFLQSDINRVVSKFFGTKKWGKGTASAKLFRSLQQDWASGKSFKHGVQKIDYHDIISVYGLGQRTSKYLADNYGISDARGKQLYNQIHKQFIKDIENHISGKKKLDKKIYGAVDKGAYNLIEIADGLKKITNSKKKSFVIDGVEYSKADAEGIVRWLIENPSRLNEVAFKDYKDLGLTNEILARDYGVKFQLANAAKGLGISVDQLKTQINHFKKLYPELDIQLKKDLGKFQGEAVLGRITGHLIDIAKGDAKIDTIPHEVSHHVVDVLRAFGDKNSKKLIKDGERMFKSEEKMVQAIGEYVAGNMKNKTMIG